MVTDNWSTYGLQQYSTSFIVTERILRQIAWGVGIIFILQELKTFLQKILIQR